MNIQISWFYGSRYFFVSLFIIVLPFSNTPVQTPNPIYVRFLLGKRNIQSSLILGFNESHIIFLNTRRCQN